MQAIETVYKGYRFRSRLEARWAVFFEALNIKYQYEPEGYVGYGGAYLPDFYLPELHVYVEVKGSDEALKRDAEKITGAIDFNLTPISREGLIILGDIPDPEPIGRFNVPLFWRLIWDDEYIYAERFAFLDDTGNTETKGIIVMAQNLREYFSVTASYPECCQFPELSDEISVENEWSKNLMVFNEHKTLAYAYKAARQARFEHGEKPEV